MRRGRRTQAGARRTEVRRCTLKRAPRFFAILLGLAIGAFGQGIKDQLPPELPVAREFGDSVQPVFEGWQRNADGSVAMWFGYLNRNRQEIVDVPVGSANSFNTAVDVGQPTHFYTRRHRYAFKVLLPKDWDKDKKLIWTLTAHGETCTAIGWMQPEWETDDGVRQMNAGGAGLAPPADPPNTAPTITGGSGDLAAEVGKAGEVDCVGGGRWDSGAGARSRGIVDQVDSVSGCGGGCVRPGHCGGCGKDCGWDYSGDISCGGVVLDPGCR